jgi:hypothetical protein
MYTTLKLLKANKACVPGFTRMITFFGNDPKIKDIRIPLYMVAIAGLPEDVSWVIENAMIIDDQEYVAFRKRHLLNLMHRAYTSYSSCRSVISESTSIFEARARIELVAARTYEAAERWLTKWNAYAFRGDVFEHVAHALEFYEPKAFIAAAFEHHRATISSRAESLFETGHVISDKAKHQIEVEFGPLPAHDPLILTDRKSWLVPSASRKNALDMLMQVFGPVDQDPNVAALEFLASNNMLGRTRGGAMLTKVTDDPKAQFHMTINLSNPDLMLKVYRLITSRGEDSILENELNSIGHAVAPARIRLTDESESEEDSEEDECADSAEPTADF